MCPHVSLATFGTQILLIYSRILLLQHVHFFAKNQDLTNLQDRLGAALQNCGKAQGFCKIAARLRAPPNCQALYSGTQSEVQLYCNTQPIVCNKNTHAFLPNFQQSSTSSHSMSILLLSCRSGNLQKLVLTTESIPLFGSIQNPCLH